MKRLRKSSVVMSKMAGSNTVPESYTCWMTKPKVNGETFSMFNKVASDAPTLSPSLIKLTLF